jgi:predicted Zn-dependent protease
MSDAPADPNDAQGWGRLGDALRLEGDGPGADRAYTRQVRVSVQDPELIAAADALADGEPGTAHRLLSALLARRPNDAHALRMFADLAARTGRHHDAETLLARALQSAPNDAQARCAYAIALHQQGKTLETLAQADILIARDAAHPLYRQLRAAALMRAGDNAQAAEAYREVLEARPNLALTWMGFGHALKTIGRQADAVAAYRAALRLRASPT